MLTHQHTQDIRTNRLLLRRFKPEDAQSMFQNWASDPSVTLFMSWEPHRDVEETKEVLQRWIADYEKEDYYHWAIVYPENGEVIGAIEVNEQSRRHERCEIGYVLSKDYWGNGLMTEAVCAVRDYLFIEVGYNRIQGIYDTRNPASGRVLVKAGMQYEGTLKQYKKLSDESFADLCLYSITQAEYNERI